MAIANADVGMLLLTADLLQSDRQSGRLALKLDHTMRGQLALRFPPIDDLVSALDHVASRESAA